MIKRTTQRNLWLPEEVNTKLQEKAHKEGNSVSSVIRRAISRELEVN